MSERTLLLGFDLGEEKSQMAVYDREKNIPVLIGQTEENPEGLIPTDFKTSEYAVLLFSENTFPYEKRLSWRND